jgi:hypothetical protein
MDQYGQGNNPRCKLGGFGRVGCSISLRSSFRNSEFAVTSFKHYNPNYSRVYLDIIAYKDCSIVYRIAPASIAWSRAPPRRSDEWPWKQGQSIGLF